MSMESEHLVNSEYFNIVVSDKQARELRNRVGVTRRYRPRQRTSRSRYLGSFFPVILSHTSAREIQRGRSIGVCPEAIYTIIYRHITELAISICVRIGLIAGSHAADHCELRAMKTYRYLTIR